jgi:hypothetical protein
VGGRRLASRHRFLLLLTGTERCDSPFRYSFSMTGYSCDRANARDRVCGSTVAGAAFWMEPGILSGCYESVTYGREERSRLRLRGPVPKHYAATLCKEQHCAYRTRK